LRRLDYEREADQRSSTKRLTHIGKGHIEGYTSSLHSFVGSSILTERPSGQSGVFWISEVSKNWILIEFDCFAEIEAKEAVNEGRVKARRFVSFLNEQNVDDDRE
jgi:hypothetical protein